MYTTYSGECSVQCQCATQYDIKNYVLPLWGWQRNLSSEDYFQHHKKSKSLLNMANGILQSMTKAEKVIQFLIQ